jgi:A/G-specific adenine glycosylase
MDKRYFSEKVVKWYENNRRPLPWRETKDPYKIWLSEIILQQTRVSQGLPYYEKFISNYATVNELATANEQEVLRHWQGLGYYTRARNLHKCAKHVVEKFNGIFPKSYHELLSLPGIGEYTAAAISSFSNKEKKAVVDGNVFRVLSRVFGIDTAVNSPEGKTVFTELANELISNAQPDIHNQAIMEFGALCCTPKNPQCDNCPVKRNCFAYAQEMQQVLPVKIKSKPSRKRYFNYIVYEHKGQLYMRKREGKDIWTGLFDFQLIEKKRPVNAKKLLTEQREKFVETPLISKTYKHVLSHQTIFTKFIILKKSTKSKAVQAGKYYSLEQVKQLPKPVLISRFLADHYVL